MPGNRRASAGSENSWPVLPDAVSKDLRVAAKAWGWREAAMAFSFWIKPLWQAHRQPATVSADNPDFE